MYRAKKAIKIHSDDGDANPEGTTGYIIGVCEKYPAGPDHGMYIILWEDNLDTPVAVADYKVMLVDDVKLIEPNEKLKFFMRSYEILRSNGAPIKFYYV